MLHQARYGLKRKASKQLQPPWKGLRGLADFESLLDQVDFTKKLQVKNWFLAECNAQLEELINREFEIEFTRGVAAWLRSQKELKQADLVKLQKEHRVRAELIAVDEEYQNNTKLKKDTAAIFPWDLPQWDEGASKAMTSASLHTNMTALGVQKTHELLEEKKSKLISRAKELETELKALGQSMF